MNSCDSCAFREGSETHDREPYNRFRGQVAALSGLPFYCHHGLNWRAPLVVRKGLVFDIDGNVQRLKVCAGWSKQVRQTITPATPDRILRRGLGQACMDQLEFAIAEKDPGEKQELWRQLRGMFLMLVKRAKLKIVRPRRETT